MTEETLQIFATLFEMKHRDLVDLAELLDHTHKNWSDELSEAPLEDWEDWLRFIYAVAENNAEEPQS